MHRDPVIRRLSVAFLRVLPFLTAAVAAPRALRIPGVYQAVGVVLAASAAAAVWTLVFGPETTRPSADRRLAVGGALLLVSPWALIVLLWVGLGTPWDATPAENVDLFPG